MSFNLYKKTGDWLTDMTHGFRGVLPGDYNTTFSSYFLQFFKSRKWPRHYQSSLVLSARTNEYLWGIVNECLCVVKRRMTMGNPVFYLILPPMHLYGDLDIERAVVLKFAKHGVGTKLSEEDLSVLGLCAETDKDIVEYIYEVTHSFPGKDYARHRNCLNKARAQQSAGKLVLSQHTRLTPLEQNQLVQLTVQWKKDKQKKTRDIDKFVTNFNEFAVGGLSQIIALPNGKPYGCSITDLVGPKQGCIPFRIHDYQTKITTDINVVLHCLDLLSRPKGLLLNIGIAGTEKGLAFAKQQLRPAKTLQIYTYKPNVKLTREMYHQTCQ